MKIGLVLGGIEQWIKDVMSILPQNTTEPRKSETHKYKREEASSGKSECQTM